MNSCTRFNNISVRRVLRAVSTGLLLLIYCAGGNQIALLHQLLHPEEVLLTHTPKEEKDPCHRSIYHGWDEGCNHEFHLVKVKSCGFCHILVTPDHHTFVSENEFPIHGDPENGIATVTVHLNTTDASVPSRGPPTNA